MLLAQLCRMPCSVFVLQHGQLPRLSLKVDYYSKSRLETFREDNRFHDALFDSVKK